MIYLDYAATTPMSDTALAVYTEANKNFFGNSQSLHDHGYRAKQILEMARQEIAGIINGNKEGVYFTSGGSESNTLAVLSLLSSPTLLGKHLITTEPEHSSSYHLFLKLQEEGYDVTFLPINQDGQICMEQLEKAIRKDTVLAAIQHANSEIGTIQPLKQIGEILHDNGVLFHTDCVQTFAKLPINVKELHIDSLSLSSHKVYGPKGVGACYINPNVKWNPLIAGTSHERGFRPGTVNVPGILSFAQAAKETADKWETENSRLKKLRNKLVSGIINSGWPIKIEGSEEGLSHILSFRAEGMEGQYLMLECNRNGLAISTGSACQVGMQSPSRTMMSLGRSNIEAKQLVRISLGMYTTENEVEKTVTILNQIFKNYYTK